MMDTQPLLRVSNIKPQDKQPAVARDSDGKQFDHHLQDQITRAETPNESANKQLKAAKSDPTPVAGSAQNEAEPAEEIMTETVVVATPDLIAQGTEDADIIINLLVMTDDDPEQALPEDGNDLPPVIADLLVPAETGPELQFVALPSSLVTKNPVAPVPEKAALAAAQFEVADVLQPSKNESPVQVLQAVMADDVDMQPVAAPEMKLQIKSEDVMSEKQFAALIAEANKSSVVSMQQVQAVTGNAAANIQSYVPPQFSAAPATTTAAFYGSVNVPLNHPAWGNQLGDQLVFMLQGKMQSAEIRLNPAHLGPMEIRLTMHEDKASVTFISAHAPVREALDAALPRLRDMMEQQGLNLANVDVSAHSGGQREAFDQQNNPSGVTAFDNQHDETEAPATVIRTQIETGLSVFV